MDTGHLLGTSTADKKAEEKKLPKNNDSEGNMVKSGYCRNGAGGKRIAKSSMIPRLKLDKNGQKGSHPKQKLRSNSSRTSLVSSKPDVKNNIYNQNLKSLEVREKSIAEYYTKIEELIQKMLAQKEQAKENEKKKLISPKNLPPEALARKMTSDTLVFNKKVKNEVLSDFEKNVKQISEIWLRTSTDLSNTLRNLKNNPSLDPIEFEAESVRIQLAIKQAKSLTLIKTRNVIAEAKKLMLSRETIRTELENLLSNENLNRNIYNNKNKIVSKLKIPEKEQKTEMEINFRELRDLKSGESLQGEESKLMEPTESETLVKDAKEPTSKVSSCSIDVKGNIVNNSENSNTKNQLLGKENQITTTGTNKLFAKNEIITQLNNKIFDLQKDCDDRTLKYNQLQLKILEFQEKIQWDHVLWKQIGKLKERIKGLQQSNKQLEMQIKEFESKIIKLNLEIERLVQLNQVLNKKKYLINPPQEKFIEICSNESGSSEGILKKSYKDTTLENFKLENDGTEKVLVEKQILISHLKKILEMMKDQENIAQKQITLFEAKIQELQKATVT